MPKTIVAQDEQVYVESGGRESTIRLAISGEPWRGVELSVEQAETLVAALVHSCAVAKWTRGRMTRPTDGIAGRRKLARYAHEILLRRYEQWQGKGS